jgi:ferredoxin
MKAEVDQVKCGTVGVCVKICPEVFRFHPGSKKVLCEAGEIPPLFRQRCAEAAEKCPNHSIVIVCE